MRQTGRAPLHRETLAVV